MALFHLQSIWLFTYTDLKTIVGPTTTFGVLNALCTSEFDIHSSQIPFDTLRRLPLVLLWTWINLLPFAISNQRQPAAVQEDILNKPWRPLSSGRLTPLQAKRLMLGLYPIAICISIILGAYRQSLSLVLLGYWYNDCKGADTSCVTRNFINACGFICYTSGAMKVALGSHMSTSPALIRWLLVIGAIVFTTVQTQDMYDQPGDHLRHRQTVPLVLGDNVGRWTIAVPVVLWTGLVPWYWQMRISGYVVPILLGLCVVYRTLTKRNIEDDKLTFRLWNIWLVSLYILPVLRGF